MSMEDSGNGNASMAMSNFKIKEEDSKSHADLRNIFINNYGVTMEIPSFYYYDAKFVPHCQD